MYAVDLRQRNTKAAYTESCTSKSQTVDTAFILFSNTLKVQRLIQSLAVFGALMERDLLGFLPTPSPHAFGLHTTQDVHQKVGSL